MPLAWKGEVSRVVLTEREVLRAVHALLRPPYYVDRASDREAFEALEADPEEVEKRLRALGYTLRPLQGEGGVAVAYVAAPLPHTQGLRLDRQAKDRAFRELLPLLTFAHLALEMEISPLEELGPGYRLAWRTFYGNLLRALEGKESPQLMRYADYLRRHGRMGGQRQGDIEGVILALRDDLVRRGYLRPLAGAEGEVYVMTGKTALLRAVLEAWEKEQG